MNPGPFFSSTTKERRWVEHIVGNYTKNLHTRPCIFQVRQSMRDENPEAYTPQEVGLGPYHHLRPELQKMESRKRASVKAFPGVKDLHRFTEFVDDELPQKLDPTNGRRNSQSLILPHYDTYLELDSRTLLWILVIDGIFLLQFLKEESEWEDQRMAADVMMLENQIPMALLGEIREALQGSFAVLDIKLLNQFNRFCNQQSPLKLCQISERIDATFRDTEHLLHFLYSLIVKNFTDETPNAQGSDQQVPKSCPLNREALLHAAREVGKCARAAGHGFISAVKQATTQGLTMPQPVSNTSKLLEQLEKTSDLYDDRDKDLQQRVADKMDVPSASQLHHIAGIKFACTNGGIRNIKFDDSTDILYLPEITLGGNSEVVLRNLVAYEAASNPAGSNLELAEYVDLMCGIIKAENDVEVLRQFGIIKRKLPDKEIVRIFNGINKSTQIPPDEQSEIQRTVQKLSNLFLQGDKENDKQHRLPKKIEVPSVSKLQEKVEIKPASAEGGKGFFFFNEKKATLYLPEIKLGDTCEEASKNLAACEVEYVDFLRAIAKDVDDVEDLKNFGIIKGNLAEEDIDVVFKRITKPIQWPRELTAVQKTVQKLNKKFNNLRVVKAYKCANNFFTNFQIWIKWIFPTLVLILLAMQQYCEFFGCRGRRSGYAAIPAGSSFGLDEAETKLMMPRKVLGYYRNVM